MKYQIEPMSVWPYEEPKPGQRRTSPFGASWSSTIDLLGRETFQLQVRGVVAIRVVGASSVVRRDGTLRATARIDYPGVALAFESVRRGPMTFHCDKFLAAGLSWQ